MTSEIDVPNLPFKKPPKLVSLEHLSFSQREAMDTQEASKRILDIAVEIANSYRTHFPKGDSNGCYLVTSTALLEMGGSLGGKMGALMVGLSERAAQQACRLTYPEVFD